MGSLRLNRLAVGRNQLARHHAQTAEALREDVGLRYAGERIGVRRSKVKRSMRGVVAHRV